MLPPMGRLAFSNHAEKTPTGAELGEMVVDPMTLATLVTLATLSVRD